MGFRAITKEVSILIRYKIDKEKISDFEQYGRMWIPLVNKLGGKHQGYFLPSEGADTIAYSLFTFPSLAAYEEYRIAIFSDSECAKAFEFAKATKCYLESERTFLRPVT